MNPNLTRITAARAIRWLLIGLALGWACGGCTPNHVHTEAGTGDGIAKAQAHNETATRMASSIMPLVVPAVQSVVMQMQLEHASVAEGLESAMKSIRELIEKLGWFEKAYWDGRKDIEAEKQHGADALRAERSHFFSFKQRLWAITLSIIGIAGFLVVWFLPGTKIAKWIVGIFIKRGE